MPPPPSQSWVCTSDPLFVFEVLFCRIEENHGTLSHITMDAGDVRIRPEHRAGRQMTEVLEVLNDARFTF